MTREPMRLEYDITKDYVDRIERLHGLAEGSRKDPHLAKLDHLAWIMVLVLLVGWIIANW